MLQQCLAAVRGPDGHRVEARQVPGRAVAGLEAPLGVGGRAEGAGLLQARLPPLRQLLVVLELLGVVLEHPELGGGLRLHVLGRGVHGLVRACVVGLRGVGHVVVPLAAPAGHLHLTVSINHKSTYDQMREVVLRWERSSQKTPNPKLLIMMMEVCAHRCG